MQYIGWDTETSKIVKHRKATRNATPSFVCLTWYDGETSGITKNKREAVDLFVSWLEDPETTIIAHNATYDIKVILRLARDLGIDLWSRLFEAYEDGRIRDTVVREILIDIANGGKDKRGYSLARLEKKYLSRDRSDQKTGDDIWRLRYAELAPWPVDTWPKEAVDYAIDDAIGAYDLFWAQIEKTGYSPLDEPLIVGDEVVQEHFQSMADLTFGLASSWGMGIDLDKAEELDAYYLAIVDDLLAKLKDHGLARECGTQDKRAIQEIVLAGWEELGLEPVLTKTGDKKIKKAHALADETAQSEEEHVEIVRDGFISAISTSKKDALKPLQKAGYKDPKFQTLIDYNRAVKFRSTYLEPIIDAYPFAVCPGYGVLVDSGRSSSWGPNIQNIPSREPKAAEIRNCFIPRPGNAFAQCDYSSMELRTLAQCCLNLGFDSKMAEALRQGIDLHLDFACQMMGWDYAEALSRLNAGDKEVKQERFVAKCFHPDTEVLTKTGWVKITDIGGDTEVAAAKCENGTLSPPKIQWEKPSRLTRRESGTMIHIASQDMDLCVTPDHRIPNWTRQGVYRSEEAQSGFWSKDRIVQCAGIIDSRADELSEVERKRLRLAVAIQADGSICERGHIRFGFTKKRKINRLDQLLHDAEVSLHSRTRRPINGKSGVFYKIHADVSDELGLTEHIPNKELSWNMLGLSERDREAILDEVRHWDSTTIGKGRSYHYCSVIDHNLDVLSAIAACTGRKVNCPEGDHWRYDKPVKVAIKDRSTSRTGGYKVSEKEYNGPVYCLTVPSDAVLVRYNGATSIVHQCANFGFPGGLGVAAFVEYAANFGTTITMEQARDLRKAWFKAWPEMERYFAYINACTRYDGKVPLRQHGPYGAIEGWRTRLCDRYTSACNSLFQGLAADAIKLAMWSVTKEAHTDPDSPLYEFKICAMIHDELILEGPTDRTEAAAERLAEIMIESAELFCPDIPILAEPEVLFDCWRK